MNRTLRVAVVGCGRMGEHHVRAATRQLGVEVVAVCDADSEVADRVGRANGIANVFSSLEALVAESTVDVAHIVTPPGQHVEAARLCLENGIHVYVEKPFAQSFEEATELLGLARAGDLIAMPGHQLIFEDVTLKATNLLPGIGRVVHVESYFSFRPSRPPDGRPPLSRPEQLMDILPHPVYLLEYFLPSNIESPSEILHLSAEARGEVRVSVRRGNTTGAVVATLRGRPVESFVRVVGTRGSLRVDYVRGIVYRSLEAGTIGKIVNPYTETWNGLWGTTRSLAKRFLKRQRFYPGLSEAFGQFYQAVREGAPSPVPEGDLLQTVGICEEAARELQREDRAVTSDPFESPTVAVSGGTGLLGVPLVRSLVRGEVTPLVLSRRTPPREERVKGASYLSADLSDPSSLEGLPASVHTVIHAAAETAGGWDAHERNSVDTTRNLVMAMSRRGIERLIYVSSIAVIAKDADEPITSNSPTEPDGRQRGPYVWGKLRAEEEARRLGAEGGVRVRVVRPSALVDYANFSPPGKLGRSLGPAFVAIGPRRKPLAIIDVNLAAEVIAWMAVNFEESPPVLNLTDPSSPTRAELVERLRRATPGLRVFWLPWPLVHLINLALWFPQKVLRPGRPPISLPAAFRSPVYRADDVEHLVRSMADAGALSRRLVPGIKRSAPTAAGDE